MALGMLGLGFGRLGSSGRVGLSAPVLAITSAESDTTPDFTAVLPGAAGAGDTLQFQIQIALADWSSPLFDDSHIITAPEDTADAVDLAGSALPDGNYEARSRITHGATTSSWSNTVSFTIAASTMAGQSIGLLLSLTKAA